MLGSSYPLIKAKLIDRAFRVTLSFDLPRGKRISIDNCKIDTGCTTTLISADSIFPSHKALEKARDADIEYYLKNGIPFKLGRGVDSASVIAQPNDYDQAKNHRNLRFAKRITNVAIDGCLVGDFNINTNYAIQSKKLIGMDMISTLDMHIAEKHIADKG